MADSDSSYVDYEQILSPSFSAHAFANTLILATNNPTDTPLDLNTPLSRVLFDLQEVDTRIDTLTTTQALPLLTYTKDSVAAGSRILEELEEQVSTLTEGYRRLEKEIGERYEKAEEARVVADRLWKTVRLGRNVGRCLTLGRQLEAQMGELKRDDPAKKEDHRVMARAANTMLLLRQVFATAGPQDGLERVDIVKTLRADLFEPSERSIVSRAEQIISNFSISSLLAGIDTPAKHSNATPTAPGFPHADDTRSRLSSALFALYLLSPLEDATSPANFNPALLLSALEGYLQRAITSSLAGLTRSLGTLPTLDDTLRLISGRCQNIVALETMLGSIKPPEHPLLFSDRPTQPLDSDQDAQQPSKDATTPPEPPANLLAPLLTSLDTPSLPSYFWRSIASKLSSRVADLVRRGGAPARTLRSNKDAVRVSLRDCVNKGSQLPASALSKGREVVVGSWEREAGVMVGAFTGGLGR